MSRIPRGALEDGYFHVVSRSVATAQALFRDPDDHETFLDIVRRTSRESTWSCHAVCLMTTHYHLVLEATRDALSAGMHRLNWRYAMYFNRKHGSFGHVFADRFATRVIEREEYLYDACAYVLLNPVRAGLCQRVEEWPWSYSSFGEAESWSLERG
jgi:REP element-mobilizing transposase RayT